MKKFIKNNLLGFILGAILFGGIGIVYAAISAIGVTYSNTNSGLKNSNGNDITNVQDAIDELYKVSKDYVKLDETTTVSSSNLLNGVTAYDNLGKLITGSLVTDEYSTFLVVYGSSGAMGELNLENNTYTKFKYSDPLCYNGNSASAYVYDNSFSNKNNLNTDTWYPINNTYYRIYLQKTAGNDWCHIKLTFGN